VPLASKRRASATRSAKSQRFGATPKSPRSNRLQASIAQEYVSQGSVRAPGPVFRNDP
jgi:hypothetical protein